MSIALISFKIEDKTVYKDDTRDYSTNWYLQGEDEPITLSYNENVKKDVPFSIEKKIDSDDCGQTISFLSADSKIRIYVDDEVIYEFGYKDERWFGKTPGSVWVFADIPLTGEGKTLRIEKVSPYDNYAGKFQNIIIGDRDKCILKLIKDNSIKLAECIVVFLGAMLLVLIVIIMSLMKQDSRSLIYFVGFVLVSDIYYLIETKTLIVFYGNETIYSIAVFFITDYSTGALNSVL